MSTKVSLIKLGPPVVPFNPFFWEGSPTKIDYRKKDTLILNSLREDLLKFRPILRETERDNHIRDPLLDGLFKDRATDFQISGKCVCYWF